MLIHEDRRLISCFVTGGGRAAAPLAVSRPVGVAVTLILLVLTACQSEPERKAAENARIERQAAKEINRICSLPHDQREAELAKIKEKSGTVLYCGSK